jgi:hypothetical protein
MKLAFALLLASAPAYADGEPPTTDPASAPSPPAPPITTEAPLTTTTSAPGDTDASVYRPLPHKDIVITVPGDRDSRNLGMLAAITGAGVLLSAAGVYYNLDAKTAADEVTVKHPTSLPWTADEQATLDRVHSSNIKAGIFYGLGGAALIGAIVTYIVTAPKSETTIIHPHYAATPTIAPAQGGAVLGGAWSF